MKYFLLCIVLFPIFSFNLFSQGETFQDTAESYFAEIQSATTKHAALWNKNIYAPILLVQRDTRAVYANQPDSGGTLIPAGKIFTGILPKEVNISNTSMRWSGTHWAMVMLPLPSNINARVNLLAHELFHRAQQELGFTAYNPENNHLDSKEGRIYLRLELKALTSALHSTGKEESREHIANALLFRKLRRQAFPQADTTENQLELNEGITEFTGLMMSGRTLEHAKPYLAERINNFLSTPTYVRSFAYETIPVYGLLLSEINPGWNKDISGSTNLSLYFEKAFAVEFPLNIGERARSLFPLYDGTGIVNEEEARETRIKEIIAGYKKKFIELPHLALHFEQMNISFDYTTIMPLENLGTVYPTIRVTDTWGILNVEKGALMSPNWDKITVSEPLSIDPDKASGEGWTLELSAGYRLVKDAVSGNYALTKKQ